MTSVSAIIVTFNNGGTIGECVSSFQSQVQQIIAVDNRSTDNTVEKLSGNNVNIEVVRSPKNVGYGRAVNSGMPFATSEHILVLNADVVVEDGAVKELLATLENNPNVAIVGPAVNNTDGSRYPTPRRFPSIIDAVGHAFVGIFNKENKWSQSYLMSNDSLNEMQFVEWVSGACFLIRKKAFEEVGGFDEKYFLYMEDVDLCRRVHEAGWNVAFNSAARVLHHQGVSTSARPIRSLFAHHVSMAKYATSTTRGPMRAALPLVWAGIAVRFFLMTVFSRRKQLNPAGSS